MRQKRIFKQSRPGIGRILASRVLMCALALVMAHTHRCEMCELPWWDHISKAHQQISCIAGAWCIDFHSFDGQSPCKDQHLPYRRAQALVL